MQLQVALTHGHGSLTPLGRRCSTTESDSGLSLVDFLGLASPHQTTTTTTTSNTRSERARGFVVVFAGWSRAERRSEGLGEGPSNRARACGKFQADGASYTKEAQKVRGDINNQIQAFWGGGWKGLHAAFVEHIGCCENLNTVGEHTTWWSRSLCSRPRTPNEQKSPFSVPRT